MEITRKNNLQIKNYLGFVNDIKNMETKHKISVYIAAILVAMYISIVIMLGLKQFLVVVFVGTFIGAYIMMLGIVYRFRGGGIQINKVKAPINQKIFNYIFFCSLGVLAIYWLAFFPSPMSVDNCNQWEQIQSFQFNDWHPVMHTLLIWLITRVCNEYSFVILIQIIGFSVATAYLGATMEAWGIKRKLWIGSIAFMILSPPTGNIMMYAWKDCAFAIFIVVLVAYLMNIYFSEGVWLQKGTNIIKLVCISILVTLMRHNAILLTIPLIGILLISYRKQLKKIVLMSVIFVLGIGLIKGPFYKLLNVEQPGQRLAEVSGLPMTILGQVMVTHPELLSTDTKTFLNQIATDQQWQQGYQVGNWNSMKFTYNGNKYIEEVGAEKLVQMTLECIKIEPKEAIISVGELTRLCWQPIGNVGWRVVPLLENNGRQEFGTLNFQWFLRYGLLGGLKMTTLYPFSWVWCTGFFILILLLAGVWSIYKGGIKQTLVIVPFMIYNWGTMLLLCGPDYRFFFFNSLITLPLIYILAVETQRV